LIEILSQCWDCSRPRVALATVDGNGTTAQRSLATHMDGPVAFPLHPALLFPFFYFSYSLDHVAMGGAATGWVRPVADSHGKQQQAPSGELLGVGAARSRRRAHLWGSNGPLPVASSSEGTSARTASSPLGDPGRASPGAAATASSWWAFFLLFSILFPHNFFFKTFSFFLFEDFSKFCFVLNFLQNHFHKMFS
jgi:hypothetical protein